MNRKIVFWIFSFLYSILVVTANHGGGASARTPNPTGISPIGWIIFIALAIGVGYFFYWIFSKGKKEF